MTDRRSPQSGESIRRGVCANVAPRGYALFSSGAGFGRAVLAELVRLNFPPRVIAIPEYPPARPTAADARSIVAPRAHPDWPDAAADAEILYLTRDRQHQGARRLRARNCDFLLVACWPWLLGAELIAAVNGAALNLHPSLLPAHRGPNPVASQLAAGDRRHGVTLHLLDAHFDHGDLVAQQALPKPGGGEDIAAIERECAVVGAQLFTAALAAYPRWNPVPQSRQEPDTD